ncbi:MAG: isoprenyl transferase [Planctomycetes bacterium]|nr:isoprenyl transferase [Planctomycetota bacterium]
MGDVSPGAILAARAELNIPDERIPRHIAIIMDGNGRWASERGLPRVMGHAAGAKVVRAVVTEAARLGLGALTLYSFSIENWTRPKEEVSALMHLYAEYLINERQMCIDHNIRLRHVGLRDGLPGSVLRELDESIRVSEGNTGMFLCLALNYGSRAEIIAGVRQIAREVAAGHLDAELIDEQVISDHLTTAGIPDPDLIVRTSGEMRLSNYLLWQSSYAEFYVTDVYWPDFSPGELRNAIGAYSRRHRRFGGIRSTGK